MVLFDHGERRSGVPAELERLGVDARGVRLPAGDYLQQAAWQGALGRALTLGASVLRTGNARDSAEWIARLYRLEGKPAAAPRGTPRLRRPTDDDLQTAEDVLRCLPGISTIGAGRLLAHFGSLQRVFAARYEDLLEVRGIGPMRARTLDRLFRATTARPTGGDVRSLAA